MTNNDSQYSSEFVNWARGLIMSKRAREALEIMLTQGSVTTEELTERYGLAHPPRAIGDLKDAGIVIEKRNVRSSQGKIIAEYTILESISDNIVNPRKPIPKKVKNKLIQDNGPFCAACGGMFNPTVLQVDHRIPFRIGGDPDEWSQETVMLLCQSDNRAKSWTCEHCPNWCIRDSSVCANCYWCHPDGQYSHIAMEQQRRLSIVWQGDESTDFDDLEEQASMLDVTMQQYVKQVLSDCLHRETTR